MAFLRNNSFKRIPVMALKTLMVNNIWNRTVMFRSMLPKFPYPNVELVSQHQLVKPRAPPIPQQEAKNDLQQEQPKLSIRKHVEFLRFADELTDEDDDDDDNVDAQALYDVDRRDKDNASKYPIKNAKGLNQLVSNIISDSLKEADRKRPKEPEFQANQQQDLEATRTRPDDIYLARFFKVQQANMQKLQKQDKAKQMHTRMAKKQERMEKLMQLQKQREQEEPITIAQRRPGTNAFGTESKRGVHFANDIWPVNMRSAAFFRHPMDKGHVDPMDLQSYTPAHKDSDNGDIQFGGAQSPFKPKRQHFWANRLDRDHEPKVVDNESAMYKVCKGLPIYTDVKCKY